MMKPTIMKFVFTAIVACIALGAIDVATGPAHGPSLMATAIAQESAAPTAPAEERRTLIWYYNAGGPLMHLILLASFIGTALIIELSVRLRRAKVAPVVVAEQLRTLFQAQNYQEAWRVCTTAPCILTNVMKPGLERIGKGREVVESTLAEEVNRQFTGYKARVSYLSAVAIISPMLGLLGTVQAIILAFGRIKTGGDPTALAGDIGIGLICTFGGLIVGILTMSTFYFFSNHVKKFGLLVEKIVVELFEEVPFQELQGVKFGAELEEDLQTSGASPIPRSAPAPMRKPQVAAVTPLAVPAVAVAPASVGPSGQTGKVTMVACPTCGTLILPRTKQCPNCKTELEWD